MIKEIFQLQNPWRVKGAGCFNLKNREILKTIVANMDNPKILGLVGSRQVGKSSLLYLLIDGLIKENPDTDRIYYFNLDDLKLHELFNSITDLTGFVRPGETKKYLFIDEIQRLENPGLFLKELHDLKLNLKIVYSGSSHLEIKSKLKEHLVGRARQFEIHRLSFEEYLDFNRPITGTDALYEMLIYGSYPEVALERGDMGKRLAIKDIHQSYVEKDLTDFLKIGNIEAFNRLLILLANQTGSLVNIFNLSKSLKISRTEVERYILALENTFIIKRIYPFYKNYKKEITKTPKIYFMDQGLRNFIINNFNAMELRSDKGELFENFCLLELLKNDPFSMNKINFWRTTNRTEIDFIVTRGNSGAAFEVKWSKSGLPKSFQTLCKYYPDIKADVVYGEKFLKSPGILSNLFSKERGNE